MIEVNENAFKIMRKLSSTCLVMFGGSWCQPCKKMKPIVEEVSDEMPGVNFAYADAGLGGEWVRHIKTLPTFEIWKDGRKISARVGAMTKREICDWIGSVE